MMMMGIHFMGDVPFRTVYIHGLVRDEKGQKMSKSKGNVMDPLELIDAYGADALRFTICSLTGPGRDVKLGRKRVEDFRSFTTKLWNAARFCEMNGIAPKPGWNPASARTPLARWILDASNSAVAEATAALEAYRFDDYAAACYRFVWGGFCDWFLEFAKPVFNGPDGAEKDEIKGAAQHVLGTILRLLHPAIPFVTEELWDRFGYGAECSLIRAEWPDAVAVADAAAAREELDWVIGLISEIRSVRADFGVSSKVLGRLWAFPKPDAEAIIQARLDRYRHLLMRLGGLFDIDLISKGDITQLSLGAEIAVAGNRFDLRFKDNVDLNAIRDRLNKERAKAEAEAKKVEAKLGNADFVARAKEEVVEENRERLVNFRAEMVRLDAAMARIAG
jgi:valyl-tRNA synthetase